MRYLLLLHLYQNLPDIYIFFILQNQHTVLFDGKSNPKKRLKNYFVLYCTLASFIDLNPYSQKWSQLPKPDQKSVLNPFLLFTFVKEHTCFSIPCLGFFPLATATAIMMIRIMIRSRTTTPMRMRRLAGFLKPCFCSLGR